MNIYNRKGNISIKEKKYVDALALKFEELKQSDPTFSFTPANDSRELSKLYQEHCVDTVAFEEVIDSPSIDSDEPVHEVSDPFTSKNPRIREYTTDGGFDDDVSANNDIFRTFDEPTTYDGAFSLPTDEEIENSSNQNQSTEQPVNNTQTQQAQRPVNNQSSVSNDQPLNPAYDTMDSAKAKKKSKTFAKQVVNTVCDLLEFGYVWYVSKDITKEKLTQYELERSMDLDLLVVGEDGREHTIKQFFLDQLIIIEEDSKIDKEDREDLIDALAEIFVDKGIALTPVQEALFIGLKTLGFKALSGYKTVSAINNLIGQIKLKKREEDEDNSHYKDNSHRDYPVNNHYEEVPSQASTSYEQNESEVSTSVQMKVETAKVEQVLFAEIPTQE